MSSTTASLHSDKSRSHTAPSDAPFYIGLGTLALFYVTLILAMLLADVAYVGRKYPSVGAFLGFLADENIRYAIKLSLISCCITTVLALWVAVPVGYVMSRLEFRGKNLLDAVLDIPIVLPPLVIGLSLLILFRQTPLRAVDDLLGISFHIPAVILAQFSVPVPLRCVRCGPRSTKCRRARSSRPDAGLQPQPGFLAGRAARKRGWDW